MSLAAFAADRHEPGAEGASNGKLAMWIFLGSEIMFFAGLIGTYIVLRISKPLLFHPDNLPTPLSIPIAGTNTLILILSSFTMATAVKATREENNAKLRRNLLITALLGCAFCGLKAVEYGMKFSHGIGPGTGIFYSCYFATTGIHALHVIGGIIPLFIFFAASKDGRYAKKDNATIEIFGLYWHFVDLVWIYLFPLLYLIR